MLEARALEEEVHLAVEVGARKTGEQTLDVASDAGALALHLRRQYSETHEPSIPGGAAPSKVVPIMSTTMASAPSLVPSPATERELGGILVPRRGQHAMVRGEGCWIWDDEGRQYLDLTASYGVAPLGHAHPALLAAINAQAGKLIALSSNFFNDRRAELLALLRARLPEHFAHFYLCNSGTEANEAALKFAFLANRRRGWVALKRSFHGRTLGALATTWNPSFRETFAPLLQTATFVDPGDLDAPRSRDRRRDLRLHRRGDPGRERGVADRAGVPAARAGALPRARRALHRRRDPDRLRPHRRLVRTRRGRVSSPT